MINLLALDLGTKTGYAYNVGEKFTCGSVELEITKEDRRNRLDRRRDPRVLDLHRRLSKINLEYPIQAVVFEDVQFASYTLQVQLWSSLRAAVWLAFQTELLECVPVGTLKKFATGNGAAQKLAMAKALANQDERFSCHQGRIFYRPKETDLHIVRIDDNAVDAVWLHKWGQKTFAQL